MAPGSSAPPPTLEQLSQAATAKRDQLRFWILRLDQAGNPMMKLQHARQVATAFMELLEAQGALEARLVAELARRPEIST